MILLILVIVAVLTKQMIFVWIALGLGALSLFSGGGQSRTGYFNPFDGGSIHVEASWYHCPEHGNVPIQHVGNPLKCPQCKGPLEKGKKNV